MFVRTVHLKDGLVKPLNDMINNVKTGVNLVVSSAANKGSNTMVPKIQAT